MEAVAGLLEPRERALGWTVAPTFELSRLIFNRVVHVLQSKFAHRIKALSIHEQRIVVVNLGGGASVLHGKSADHPASLLGESLDFLIVDEAAQLRANIWTEHLSRRLLDRKGWALFLSTPRGRDWFWRLFRRGQRGRDPAYESWSRPSWDNPYLDRTLIDDERNRLSSDVFAAQYAGEFTGEDLEPCDVCGGPSPSAKGIVVLQKGEELAHCHECNRGVDANGRTLVRRFGNGTPSLMVIRLEERRDGTMPTLRFAKPDQASRCIQLEAEPGASMEVGPN